MARDFLRDSVGGIVCMGMEPTLRSRKSSFIIALCTLALGALPVSNVLAHEGEDHKHSHGPATAASASEAWKSAQASVKAMEAAAVAKQHEPIHDEQEKLVGFLTQIQKENQSADKSRLDGAIKNAITASEKVHTAADAKDFAKVESGLKTLQTTMGMVEKQISAAK